MKISIIIPTYNEEKTLLEILKKVNIQKKNYNLQIIVSDDSSTDKTKDLLLENKNLYDQVVFNKENLGKGSAIINSLNVVTGDYILIQDADLEYDPTDYKRLLEPVLKDNADVVFGSRFQGSDPKRILYFSHRVANFILTFSNCFNISSYFSSNSVSFLAELTSLFKVSIVASFKSISSFKEETIFSSVDISLFKAKISLLRVFISSLLSSLILTN